MSTEIKVYTVSIDNPNYKNNLGASFSQREKMSNEPLFIKADVVLKSDHDLSLRKANEEIRVLREQRDRHIKNSFIDRTVFAKIAIEELDIEVNEALITKPSEW